MSVICDPARPRRSLALDTRTHFLFGMAQDVAFSPLTLVIAKGYDGAFLSGAAPGTASAVRRAFQAH
jgi:hypothetical protein